MSASSDNRPLSPHLQIYRLPLTAKLSILHRATGVFLSMGTALLAIWLVALATGGEAYACVDAVMKSWFGMLCLVGWSYALLYHLCTGIRHLIWDVGIGLENDSLKTSGPLVIVASVILTAAVWAVALL
ncbi:MAG: succinate dehydrogenase, cytochrome b556 subunit [Nevskiales bacterium]